MNVDLSMKAHRPSAFAKYTQTQFVKAYVWPNLSEEAAQLVQSTFALLAVGTFNFASNEY
eukprot:1144601-Pelagomonas_calceolata.AAC.2